MPKLKLNLTDEQQTRLYDAYGNQEPFHFEATINTFTNGTIPFTLTEAQIRKLKNGERVEIKKSKIMRGEFLPALILLLKKGGFLPAALIPLLAALVPAAAATGATVVKTYHDVKNQKAQTEEVIRHNRALEEQAKKGMGFFYNKMRHLTIGDGLSPNTMTEMAKEAKLLYSKIQPFMTKMKQGKGLQNNHNDVLEEEVKKGMGFFYKKMRPIMTNSQQGDGISPDTLGKMAKFAKLLFTKIQPLMSTQGGGFQDKPFLG